MKNAPREAAPQQRGRTSSVIALTRADSSSIEEELSAARKNRRIELHLSDRVQRSRTRVSRYDRWYVEMAKPVQLRSAWPLAERYEALVRVFNNPLPYAKRIAARLHAEPHRAVELLQAPPEAEHRVDRFAEFGTVAEERRTRFSSG